MSYSWVTERFLSNTKLSWICGLIELQEGTDYNHEVRKQYNMQKSSAKHKSKSTDTLWYFLVEYSLSEFTLDDFGDKLKNGLLFQTIQDLGVPPECLKKIEMTLTGFVNQSTFHSDQGKSIFPIVIRLFVREKMLRLENSAKTAEAPQEKPTIEGAQIISPPGTQRIGGWGFFIIEKARDLPAVPAAVSPNFIDLYLYQEAARTE